MKLFKNGRSSEIELPGNDAIIRKEHGELVIETSPPESLLVLLATLKPIPEAFGQIDDAAPEPVDL